MGDMNTADWARVEAALHEGIERTPVAEWNPRGLKAWKRTLDKVQRINKTGRYTP